MTQAEFIKILEEKGYSYELKEGKLTVNYKGGVDLSSLTKLPDTTVFNNRGSVDLHSLTKLPDNTVFNNGGSVYLSSLTTLPNNTIFNNQGNVYLHSLTKLPDNFVFNNQGYVYLHSLTKLPDTTVFNNQGYVYLGSLTPNAINAGDKKRNIRCWRHKTRGILCSLGCFVGTREQAIEAIKDKYTDINARDAYIAKVDEAFADYLANKG